MSESEQETPPEPEGLPANRIVIEAPEGSGEPDNEIEPPDTGEHVALEDGTPFPSEDTQPA